MINITNTEIDDFDFLTPDSELVFYDNEHGFCINTQDVMDCIKKVAIPVKKIRRTIKMQLCLLAEFPEFREEIIEKIMILSGILGMSNEEVSDIIDKGFKNFIV